MSARRSEGVRPRSRGRAFAIDFPSNGRAAACSPHGAKRNAGATLQDPDCASLHPGYGSQPAAPGIRQRQDINREDTMIARREFLLGAAAAGVLMQPRFGHAKASQPMTKVNFDV